MSVDETSGSDSLEDEGPTSSAFMSLIRHDCDAPEDEERDTIEFEDQVGRIAVSAMAPRTTDDGDEMGPIVDLTFSGIETNGHVHIMLDAHEALDLVGRLAYAAGKAIEESRHA
jgi:hypothetical protein